MTGLLQFLLLDIPGQTLRNGQLTLANTGSHLCMCQRWKKSKPINSNGAAEDNVCMGATGTMCDSLDTTANFGNKMCYIFLHFKPTKTVSY